ncbi:hypothetical protein ACFQJ5_12070 [Halomicroarcula sp. GCM10025324]|uniref:hypothetical protein n=1 Tax=Haloarcula TaxID=2237 RepID=UPI0023E7934C|nr:hypothetical protein [Halomicroarcula sp. ZS-22-S1]
MCYDRLTDEGVAEMRLRDLVASELRCSLRNGGMAGVMVLAVLLVQGASALLLLASVVGAVALGAVLHQCVFVAGALVQRGRVRVGGSAEDSPLESA